MGPADSRRAHLRSVGRHEGVHVREDKRGPAFLWRAAEESVGGSRHSRARLRRRADRSVRGPLASEADGRCGRDPRGRKLRVHLVHVKYGEIPPIIMSAVLGLLMAFIAYG